MPQWPVLVLSNFTVTKKCEPISPPLKTPKTPTFSRNPFRSHSRNKSIVKVDMDAVRSNSSSPDSVSSSASGSSYKMTTSIRTQADELAWRAPYTFQRPPLLKLSVPNLSRKPNLETIPGSPPYNQTGFSVDPPTFSLPSESSLRRQKLRRVKKVLGDGVPADLLFPSSVNSDSESEDSPLLSTPTSAMSCEWLLADAQEKPLPEVPAPPVPSHQVIAPMPVELAHLLKPEPPKAKAREAHPNRLFKEKPKKRPSAGAQRLESIRESAREVRPPSLTAVGVSASAGMNGKGRSRRFIEGEVQFDQICTAFGMHNY